MHFSTYLMIDMTPHNTNLGYGLTGTLRVRELAETIRAAMVEGYMGDGPHVTSARSLLAPGAHTRYTAQFANAQVGMAGVGKSFTLCGSRGLT